MRSAAVLALAGLAAAYGPGGDSWGHGSGSWGTAANSYVTEVVTAYTTYCPSATVISHGPSTWTVTEATTLTISNCPCTVTRPVSSWVVTSSTCTTAKPSSAAATPVVGPSSAPPAGKPSSYFPSVAAPSSAAPVTSAPATYTGAASKAQVAGAGLLAVMGAAVVAL